MSGKILLNFFLSGRDACQRAKKSTLNILLHFITNVIWHPLILAAGYVNCRSPKRAIGGLLNSQLMYNCENSLVQSHSGLELHLMLLNLVGFFVCVCL